MAERDSLLDLDVEAIPQEPSEPIVIDNTSRTVPPGRSPFITDNAEVLLADPDDQITLKSRGVPSEPMPVGTQETTKPIPKLDLADLSLSDLFKAETGKQVSELMGTQL